MNQILQVEMKKNKNKPADIRKILVFFAVSMLLFGVIIAGQGIYRVVVNNKNNKGNIVETKEQPQISITKQDKEILIKVTHSEAISNVSYKINDGNDVNIDIQDNKLVEKSVELAEGINTVHVVALAENGEVAEYEEEYTIYAEQKPMIILSVTNDNKIKIVAKDEVAIQNITYSWNDEQENVKEADTNDIGTIETEIDIPYGQNTLKVVATNSVGVSVTKELDVKGINKPKVTVTREGDYLFITAEDEKAMKVVNYTLNGKRYQLNFGEVKVMRYKQLLDEGENILILSAENTDGIITEYKGKCIK